MYDWFEVCILTLCRVKSSSAGKRQQTKVTLKQKLTRNVY